MQKMLQLYNGIHIPCIGYGTWRLPSGSGARDGVKTAIRAGYRNIDTATIYHNEKSVGEGVRQAITEQGISREELFISTKVWNDHRGYDLTMKAFEDSMDELGLSYLDLYMIHWPAVAKWHDDWREINQSTWKALEELYKGGRVKAMGVSNFLIHHIQAIIDDAEIKPMVNQLEYHPGFGQTESAEFCLKNDIIVEAWSPFGTGEVLQNPQLISIAEKYNKQTSHICLRWLLQKGFVPLPRSVREERILSNIQVFDFELSDEDIEMVDRIPYCGGIRLDPDTAKS